MSEDNLGADLQGAFDALREDLVGQVSPPPFERVRARYLRRRRRRLAGGAGIVAVMAVAAALVVPQVGPGRGGAPPVSRPRPTVTVTVPPSPVASLGPLALRDVSFSSVDNGVALGHRCTAGSCAVLAATSDNGGYSFGAEHLIATNVPASADASKIAAIAGTSTVYAYGPGLYMSADGGNSWRDVQPFGLAVVDVVVGGATLTVLANAADGSAQIGQGAAGALNPAYQFSPVPGFSGTGARLQVRRGVQIVTSTGGVFVQTSRGLRWQQKALPANCARPSLSAVGDATWWLLCTGSGPKQVFLTRDGGNSWPQTAMPPAQGDATTITGLSAQTAFLSGDNTALIQTGDGGSSWQLAVSVAGSYGEPHVIGDRTWLVSGTQVLRRVGNGPFHSADVN